MASIREQCLLISVRGVAADARKEIQTETATLGDTDEVGEPLAISEDEVD